MIGKFEANNVHFKQHLAYLRTRLTVSTATHYAYIHTHIGGGVYPLNVLFPFFRLQTLKRFYGLSVCLLFDRVCKWRLYYFPIKSSPVYETRVDHWFLGSSYQRSEVLKFRSNSLIRIDFCSNNKKISFWKKKAEIGIIKTSACLCQRLGNSPLSANIFRWFPVSLVLFSIFFIPVCFLCCFQTQFCFIANHSSVLL